jgi:hypothetical protein
VETKKEMKKSQLTPEQRLNKKRQQHRDDYWKHHEQRLAQRRLDNPKLSLEEKRYRQEKKKNYDEKYKPTRHIKRAKLGKQLRYKIINYYSNGTMKCIRCGFSDIRALTIDHINGGGCDHKKQINRPLMTWIKQNNFPDGFQILCMNCQKIKQIENGEIQYKKKRKLSANQPPKQKCAN